MVIRLIFGFEWQRYQISFLIHKLLNVGGIDVEMRLI